MRPLLRSGTLPTMSIDIVSVILVVALCGLFLCLALALAVDWPAPEPGTRWWIAGFAALAIGFCGNGLQGILPPVVALTGASTLLVAGIGVLLIGTVRFFAAPLRFEIWTAAAVVITAIASLLMLFVWPSVNGRVAATSVIMAAQLSAFAWVLVRHAPRSMSAPARLTAAAAMVMAALLLLRTVEALLSAPMASSIQSGPLNSTLYLSATLAQLSLGLGCYFMIMIRRNDELKALSATDPLTGSLNRRGLFVATARAEHDYRRTWIPYSVIMLDLDHFKRVNDNHGHAAGDAVLQCLVDECNGKLRGDSVVARLGGEEFCILLPGCQLNDAHAVGERIRTAFGGRRIDLGGVAIACTVSMGVAQCHAKAPDFEAVCKDADAALYRAKQSGRNRAEKAPLPADDVTIPGKPRPNRAAP